MSRSPLIGSVGPTLIGNPLLPMHRSPSTFPVIPRRQLPFQNIKLSDSKSRSFAFDLKGSQRMGEVHEVELKGSQRMGDVHEVELKGISQRMGDVHEVELKGISQRMGDVHEVELKGISQRMGEVHEVELKGSQRIGEVHEVEFKGRKRMAGVLEVELKVRDYELNRFGIVKSATYANYCQHSIQQLLEKFGIIADEVVRNGGALAISEQSLKYRAPLKSGDRFVVKVGLSYPTAARLFTEHFIFRLPDQELVLEARGTIVWLNKSHRPVRIPSEIRSKFV